MKVYLVHGARTPFGRFAGSLKDLSPIDLAQSCSQGLFDQLKMDPAQVDHTVFANVLPSTTDTLYAGRHLALRLGIPLERPAYTVNRLCGSGIQALWEASNMIKLQQANCILCSGAEAMSLTPHLVYGSRFGTKFGPLKTVDFLMDSLTDQQAGCPMGVTAENLARDYGITREEADDFSFESHERAQTAWAQGFLKEVHVGDLAIKRDEHVRTDRDRQALAKLRPSFIKEGIVTAGNASGIVDGAASAIVASESVARENNWSPLAEIVDFSVVGVEPTRMGIGPVPAIQSLLKKTKLKIEQIDLFEINEAFASQVIACQKELQIDSHRLNVWGGAIAYGHPLGATGLRITQSLAFQMRQLDKGLGIAAACIGGGQGIAVLLKRDQSF